MDKSVKKKLIKEKKKKSFYGKWFTPMLLLYGLSIVVLCAIVMIVTLSVPFEKAELAATISGVIAVALFIAISLLVVFYFTPLLKKKQARIDFARCDFTPYISCGESEIFTCEYHMCRYTMDASPFDEETTLNFKNDTEAKEYISQHFAQELKSTRLYENGMEKSPFFIAYYFEADDGISVRIEKKTDGELTTLDIYEIHTAEFTEEGLKLGEKVIPYNLLEVDVATGFDKSTDFYVAVRLIIGFEGGYLSFQFSSRIAEVIKRFNITVYHKEAFDYILNDPLHAFEQTALQLGLKKLK
ncbi:MAG: hypothetical protein ACI4VK_02330 [Candidatus Coproplasma sp.]